MARVTIHNSAAEDVAVQCDLICTDPPFEMSASKLAHIFSRCECDHLVMISTMRQLTGLLQASDWVLNFDFVIDSVVPKKSMNIRQPNYTHATGAYLTRNGVSSRFNRKLRQRSDTFDNKGYWPTILRAPRERLEAHGHAKNQQALIDILGSFEISSVYDPFAGSGTTGFACIELDVSCTLTERNSELAEKLKQQMRFFT